jgi:hypothetical protein
MRHKKGVLMKQVWILMTVLCAHLPQSAFSSLAANAQERNQALLLSVAHGLPGLDLDILNAKTILTDSSNQFQTVELKDVKVAQAAMDLKKVAQTAGPLGSFAFYYTGHGLKGGLFLQDATLSIQQIRKAIEEARIKEGPLSRLVLIFDSCYSGSLIDPIRKDRLSADFADEVVRVMTAPSRDGQSYSSYWKELIVFASAAANETCLAGDDGSQFTVALKKSWDSVIQSDGTIGEFIAATKKGTVGSHPVERLVPASLAESKLGRTY